MEASNENNSTFLGANINVWLVYAFQDERQYRGNDGYEDVLEQRYVYDSNVPNFRNLRQGDIVVVCGTEWVLGIAVVERIFSESATKPVRRCPVCGTTGIKARRRTSPPFRCNEGHEFEQPVEKTTPITRFIADYGDSFTPLHTSISRRQAQEASDHPRAQLSIRRLRPEAVLPMLTQVAPEVLQFWTSGQCIGPYDASPEFPSTFQPYKLSAHDTRSSVFGLIRLRRGQAAFRNHLIRRYGGRCMVTGCDLLDVLEAAHISPWRGDQDQNAENGLLLRSDVHTLFDLNLIGIRPGSLQVFLNPKAKVDPYKGLDGGYLLGCESNRPSQMALVSRWRLFEENMALED